MKYKKVDFFRANLENQDLRGQNFDGADFRKANLRMAILEDASCEPTSVTTSAWALLAGFILSNGVPQVGKRELKPTNFSEADLTGANLKRAKLREANFHSAILRNTNFSEATLINADLSGTDLRKANLSYTDMTGALFYQANLEGADLTGAKLDGADFEDAILKNTILHNVVLRKVKYLSSANLAGADIKGAIMPDNKAVLKYQEAVRLDPDFEDAKANLAEAQAEYQNNRQQNTDGFSDQQTNGSDRAIIMRQWIAFIAFILFFLAGLIAFIFSSSDTISSDTLEAIKYSLLAAFIPLLYVSISSIKNRISIARQGGLWNYAKGMPAVSFGIIMLILASACIAAVLYYFP